MIKIRKATVKDFDELKSIKSEFYLWGCRRDKRMKPSYVERGLGSRLAKDLRNKDRVFFIAEDNGRIIGYSGAEIKKNPAFIKHPLRGYIFNLYVKSSYRNKGIGKQLIKETLKWFKTKNISDLYIVTHSFNKKACKLYKRMGFKDYTIEMVG